MTRKKRLLVSVLVAFVLTGFISSFMWLTGPKPGVTRENYERIGIGMTEAEVEAIVNSPSVSYPPDEGYWDPRVKSIRRWDDGPYTLTVEFDGNGRVRSKEFGGPKPKTWLEKLQGWLGL